MTLHCHEVDNRTLAADGNEPVLLPEGWEIAPGDADDIRVCAAHPWQSHGLVCQGCPQYFGTSMCRDPSRIGACAQQSNENFKLCLTPENRETHFAKTLLSYACKRPKTNIGRKIPWADAHKSEGF
jgi:hypothetical protein